MNRATAQQQPWLTCLCLLAIALLLVAAGCGEQPYRRYAGAAEAIAAGERERGWYPAWLSASASSVHVQGDLDSSDWWIRADLPAPAADSLRTHLEPVEAGQVRVRRPRSSASWWFESLIDQHPENDGGLYADLFRGTGEPVPASTVVAFKRGSQTVFIWSGGIR